MKPTFRYSKRLRIETVIVEGAVILLAITAAITLHPFAIGSVCGVLIGKAIVEIGSIFKKADY